MRGSPSCPIQWTSRKSVMLPRGQGGSKLHQTRIFSRWAGWFRKRALTCCSKHLLASGTISLRFACELPVAALADKILKPNPRLLQLRTGSSFSATSIPPRSISITHRLSFFPRERTSYRMRFLKQRRRDCQSSQPPRLRASQSCFRIGLASGWHVPPPPTHWSAPCATPSVRSIPDNDLHTSGSNPSISNQR